MYEYRHIIVQIRLGASNRQLAKAGLVGRNKAKEIRQIAAKEGWLNLEQELPCNAVIAKSFGDFETGQIESGKRIAPYQEKVTQWVEQGVQATTIHQALIREFNYPGSYNSVQRFVKSLKEQTKNVTVPLSFAPGEAAQVDFGAGPVLDDPKLGKVKTWFFVMTLCWSRHQYAELVLHQDTQTWLGCHQRAFEWFGGVPSKIIIDNPKCAITKACYHTPTVQRSYREFAEGYRFMISPCPPYDPQKKGRVEAGVKYIKRNFMPLRKFQSLSDANNQLKQWVTGHAGNRKHGSTFKKPLSQFKEIEQSTLTALPEKPPELATWEKGIVYRDCHIRHKQCLYSVPYEHVGQTVWFRVNETTVRVYKEHEMIAIHTKAHQPGEQRTCEEHLPPNAQYYLKRTPEWCHKQAKAIGDDCQHVIETLLKSKVVDQLRAAHKIIQMKDDFSPERLNAACRRARSFNSIDYNTIRTILKKGLDYEAYHSMESFDALSEIYSGKGTYMRTSISH
jgi:transposase